MFRAIAALALASTSAQSPATLTSNASWWERVTVTVTDDGKTHSCRYETSLQPAAGTDCAVDNGHLPKLDEDQARAYANDLAKSAAS